MRHCCHSSSYEAGWHRWSGQARICTWFLAKHFFPNFGFERAIGEYGQPTGVISPGLILPKTCAPMQKLHMPEHLEASVAVVLDFSHRFGSFQKLECRTLERKLIDMEFQGTGRVRMADFYSNALNGGWEFMESYQYLHNQGALDETDPTRPSIIIPNNVNNLTKCMAASSFYTACCVSECDALMSILEKQ